jgi:hypothetical protein
MKKITGLTLLFWLILVLSACTPGPDFVVNSEGG